MNEIINRIAQTYFRKEVGPQFRPGDTIKVWVRIQEAGGKTRLQAFQGDVIRRNGGGISETFTVRKTSYGVGVERIFPLHSPSIDRIELVRKGKVRRARLYYLRNLSGKSARIREVRRDSTARDDKSGQQQPAAAETQK